MSRKKIMSKQNETKKKKLTGNIQTRRKMKRKRKE